MQEIGLRLEDYGRQAMEKLPRLSEEKIIEGFYKYLSLHSHAKYFMIVSNRVGYSGVFKVESQDSGTRAKNIVDYLKDSRYYNIEGEENPYVEMIDIRHYELNEDHKHLELWIGKEYFQFFPYDWGVEII